MRSLKHSILSLGLLLRIILLCWGEYQDRRSLLKYTDIDYTVFTDASFHVSNGESPYQSIGYRYTPLLAWALLPNITWFPQFGKLLFVACDLLVGVLIVSLLKTNQIPIQSSPPLKSQVSPLKYQSFPLKFQSSPLKSHVSTLKSHSELSTKTDTQANDNYDFLLSSIWILNPFIATISTRGSSESILALLVLSSLLLLIKDKLILSSILFGVSVHFKIYPIIYAIPIWFYIDKKTHPIPSKFSWVRLLTSIITQRRALYGIISASVFLLLNCIMYYLYGQEFLQETYFYHVTRKDHRHNFSIYFYHIYLSYENKYDITRLTSFLPQLGSVVYLGYSYAQTDLIFASFLQTFAFVMMNKVCTSQYFIWWLCFLPMVLKNSRLIKDKKVTGLLMAVGWIATQALWLFLAFQLEFEGKNRYYELFAVGAVLFVMHLWMLIQFMKWRIPCTSDDISERSWNNGSRNKILSKKDE